MEYICHAKAKRMDGQAAWAFELLFSPPEAGNYQGIRMHKPTPMAVATSIFIAGICNAFIFTLGYITLVAIQFLTKDGGDGDFSSAITAFIMILIVSLLISSIITFLLAFPIAIICRLCGFIGNPAYIIAPAVGAALACWVASLLDVVLSTHIAIIAFAYITSAIMWMTLTQSGAPRATFISPQPSRPDQAST